MVIIDNIFQILKRKSTSMSQAFDCAQSIQTEKISIQFNKHSLSLVHKGETTAKDQKLAFIRWLNPSYMKIINF